MKSIIKLLLFLVVAVLLVVGAMHLTGNGYVLKAIRVSYLKGYTTSNIDDHADFSNNVVHAGAPVPWVLHKDYNRVPLTDTLRHELETFETAAFVVIKEGKLWYEEYWDGYSESSLTNSFSMAKSVTTLLLGKALEEGHIKSLDQWITDFLPEFLSDSLGSLCTVGDLSAMTSGFDWEENYYSAFNPTTKAYYGDDVEKQMLSRHFSTRPGGHFRYCSADTQLLAILLRRATGKSLSAYLSEHFWTPMGMEHDALWSTGDGLERAFCCLHTNARDFARLGQLLLQHGNWNGVQLLDSAFIDLMTRPHMEVFAAGEMPYYGYSIWVDASHEPAFYCMMGHLGQRVIGIPSQGVVIVRLGHKNDARPGDNPMDSDTYYFVNEVTAMLKGAV